MQTFTLHLISSSDCNTESVNARKLKIAKRTELLTACGSYRFSQNRVNYGQQYCVRNLNRRNTDTHTHTQNESQIAVTIVTQIFH
jgi:hypothetical protein